jgi:hypothetical protein
MDKFIEIGYNIGWAAAQINDGIIHLDKLKERFEHIDFEELNNCLASAKYYLEV